MSNRRPMTDIERDIASAAMDGDRAGLRKAVDCLRHLDGCLFDLVSRQTITESVATLLEAGAYPTPRALSSAIRRGHVDAVREMLQYVSLDAEYRGFAVPALQDVLGETWGTEALMVLLDSGLGPSPELARAAQLGHNSDALRLLRERGLTEEDLIQGVCAR